MTTQEVPVSSRAIVDVTLVETSLAIEEVVVVGYATQTKKTLSGAVSAVTNDALVKTLSPTVSGAMVGQMPGITTRLTDGRPGGATSLQIRNFGTPLYIIDGVPRMEVDFNNLSMDNIESISVLKDA